MDCPQGYQTYKIRWEICQGESLPRGVKLHLWGEGGKDSNKTKFLLPDEERASGLKQELL